MRRLTAMKTYDISDEALRAEVQRLAVENPDMIYVNPDWLTPEDRDSVLGCNYLHGEEPGCIFGHALTNLGVAVGDLRMLEGSDIDFVLAALHTGEPGMWDDDNLTYMRAHKKTGAWANYVQGAQDKGLMWLDAVQSANESVGLNALMDAVDAA